ncbi:MAG: SET domain-containing protein-lysine N-methyltransferase, partial [Sphingobacteriales bacterium]
MLKEYLKVGHTANKGRGVFTSVAIEADTIIEIASVIVMTKE